MKRFFAVYCGGERANVLTQILIGSKKGKVIEAEHIREAYVKAGGQYEDYLQITETMEEPLVATTSAAEDYLIVSEKLLGLLSDGRK